MKKSATGRFDYVRDVDFPYNGGEKGNLLTTTSTSDMMDHDDAKIRSGEIRMQQQSISGKRTRVRREILR